MGWARSELLHPASQGGKLADFTANGALLGVPQPFDNVEGRYQLGVRFTSRGYLVAAGPFGQKRLSKSSQCSVLAGIGELAGGAARPVDSLLECLQPGRAIGRRLMTKTRCPNLPGDVAGGNHDERHHDDVVRRHDRPPRATPSADFPGTPLHERPIPFLGRRRDEDAQISRRGSNAVRGSSARTKVPARAMGIDARPRLCIVQIVLNEAKHRAPGAARSMVTLVAETMRNFDGCPCSVPPRP